MSLPEQQYGRTSPVTRRSEAVHHPGGFQRLDRCGLPGVHFPVPREQMTPAARKLRDTYALTPGAPFYHRTFGLWMCLDTWHAQGLPRDVDIDSFFLFDPPGGHILAELGWCEGALLPTFEEQVIADEGGTEIVLDSQGRHVRYFRQQRQGFMPEYVDHPVKDHYTWQTQMKWRLDPQHPQRFEGLETRMRVAQQAAAQGRMIQQRLVGGYMFLRSLIGPEELLYLLYDMPELIHDCMRTWLALADAVIARHQEYVTLDELFMAEDICYNHGPLISPDMMRQFLFPYYQQLIRNVRLRQRDPDRHLYVQIDTDGYALPVIPLYRDAIGMDVMSPFEVASGCDVVQTGRDYPDLVMAGGIDKRVLAQSPAAIDRHLEAILPTMRARGGYIPTCDHGVPTEVKWQQYLHYRRRCVEYGS